MISRTLYPYSLQNCFHFLGLVCICNLLKTKNNTLFEILVTVTQSATTVPETNNTSTSGKNEE